VVKGESLTNIGLFVIGPDAEMDAKLFRDLAAGFLINGRQINNRRFNFGNIFLCFFSM
jgi:hypothetical protein